ncbi:ABC transporter substrate-binding protein [Kineococcus sp. SYSU DK004]|uniref:ABC transporter substrate-binding protein n=1 Tax=Kineococcus sp. SYSU DK004 TaxID=3383125 RepID=UPI003D7CAAD8
MTTTSARTRLGLALTVLVAATGCGASEPVQSAPVAVQREGATRYPLTLESCGQELTIDAPPQRVVSLDQGSTEILLSLGLQDAVVGTASWTDPLPPSLEGAGADVPRLADNAPTWEVVLGADPDLVTASFGRHFTRGGVAERSRFAETGIPTYLSPTDCDGGTSVNGGGTRTAPVTMDAVYAEVRELAEVFDVQQRGEELVADLQRRREAALRDVDAQDVTVALWFADTRTPYVAGGLGSANLLTADVGARNVFADLTDDWPAVGWETVVERDPQVLVLGDLARDRFPGDRLADKVAFLRSDPLTATMPAVREEAFIALHGAEMNPSIRAVDGLEKIAAGLREIRERP